MDPEALRGADVVIGFPGPGLVGGIVVESLVEELRLVPVGCLGGTALPPQALVEAGRPYWPVLVFARPGFAVIKAEADLDGSAAHALGRAIAAMLKRSGVRTLTLVDGLPGVEPGDAGHVWSASSDEALRARYEEAGALVLEEGAFGGGAAATALWAAEVGLACGYLASPARMHLPDARSAALVLDVLARLYGLGIDGRGLEQKGEQLELAWGRLMDEAQAAVAQEPRDANMYS